jgi:leader peptidase (prepilin peptidase)/N-methyltransferase
MTAVLVLFAFLFGVNIGSFLNVVIWRVPRDESIVRPPSHCPRCDQRISPRDNIPVLSWLVLRGRCRRCDEPISSRYPAVELFTGVLFAVVSMRFGPVAELPAYLYLAAIAVALALIDIDTKRLPNAIVLPSYAVAGTLLTVAAAASGEWDQLLRAGLGGAVMYAFYFVLAVAKPGAMGFGDVKLAGVLGLYLGWLGWSVLVVGLFLGFLFGGALGALLMVVGRASRKSKIPYGPFMLLGAFVAVLFGSALAGWYATSLGLSDALGVATGVRA